MANRSTGPALPPDVSVNIGPATMLSRGRKRLSGRVKPNPLEANAALSELMSAGASNGVIDELAAQGAEEYAQMAPAAPEEFAQPLPSDLSEHYRDYANGSFNSAVGKILGIDSSGAENMARMRIADVRAQDEKAREDAYKMELMSPGSATALRQQDYLARLGVDASGLGANDINALNVPEYAAARATDAADLQKKQMELAVKEKIAAMKRKGGGGSGKGLAGLPGVPQEQMLQYALKLADGDPVGAQIIMRDPKALLQAMGRADTQAQQDKARAEHDAEAQRKNIAGATQDYAKQRDFLEKNMGPINEAYAILSKYGTDLPGVGPIDSGIGKSISQLKENLGMGNQWDRDTLELDRLSNVARQLRQQLVTGMGVSIPEGIENQYIAATNPKASEPQRRAALKQFFKLMKDYQANLDAGFGPQVVGAYKGNKARAQGQIAVRSKTTNEIKYYPLSKEASLKAAPGFSDNYEILGSGY